VKYLQYLIYAVERSDIVAPVFGQFMDQISRSSVFVLFLKNANYHKICHLTLSSLSLSLRYRTCYRPEVLKDFRWHSTQQDRTTEIKIVKLEILADSGDELCNIANKSTY
jgi:hypothetical protein